MSKAIKKAAAPIIDHPDAPTPATGPVYEQFLVEVAKRGFKTTPVITVDYIGEAVQVLDPAMLKNMPMPIATTVANGQYYVHPVLRVRDLT